MNRLTKCGISTMEYCCYKKESDNMEDLENIMLSEIGQLQKTTYCMIAFTWNVQNMQIQRNRKLVSRQKGQRREEWGVTVMGVDLLRGWWKCYGVRSWWWLYNFVNALKTTLKGEFYDMWTISILKGKRGQAHRCSRLSPWPSSWLGSSWYRLWELWPKLVFILCTSSLRPKDHMHLSKVTH